MYVNWYGELGFCSGPRVTDKSLQIYCDFLFFLILQLTGLPTTSGAVGTKEAPKQAVAADADADLQARSVNSSP